MIFRFSEHQLMNRFKDSKSYKILSSVQESFESFSNDFLKKVEENSQNKKAESEQKYKKMFEEYKKTNKHIS